MLIIKEYDKQTLTEEAFYESSNVFYSKCNDNKNDLKTLLIVFNNGGSYIYYDVDVKDYLKFRNADSQGKAFNQYLGCKKSDGTPKYKVFKLGVRDLEPLKERLADMQAKAAEKEANEMEEPKQEEASEYVAPQHDTRHMYITEKEDGHVTVKNEFGYIVDITKMNPVEVAEKMCNLFRIQFTKSFA